MSNFAYIQYVNYLNLGSPLTGGAGTVTDLDNDDEFDSLDNDGNGWLYAGTLVIDGITMPVFTNNGSFPAGAQQIYNPGPSTVTWPLTLDSSITSTFTAANFAFCFAAGTGIATPNGEVAVETLAIGDLVLTAEGASVPVKWIGRQTVFPMFGPADRLMPVRFAAGSLGDGLPRTDLTVTADHGMLVEDVICHAGALVNGTTITRVPLSEMGERYTVYHVETEAHEIILANGAPAETFIDNVSRRVFDNYAEFEALYGEVPEMEELPYPRAMSARQVPERLRKQLSRLIAV
ncbi:Hint domain-containing protein [Nioella ostreopsis]|uniref:Hint domain-containing protein n=1 Tax=Nioella ostreopsis TaxID=2448479 RepID=UPI000FD77CA9|nr:Hint domain-containing protein [Nioella ostreopsis]